MCWLTDLKWSCDVTDVYCILYRSELSIDFWSCLYINIISFQFHHTRRRLACQTWSRRWRRIVGRCRYLPPGTIFLKTRSSISIQSTQFSDYPFLDFDENTISSGTLFCDPDFLTISSETSSFEADWRSNFPHCPFHDLETIASEEENATNWLSISPICIGMLLFLEE